MVRRSGCVASLPAHPKYPLRGCLSNLALHCLVSIDNTKHLAMTDLVMMPKRIGGRDKDMISHGEWLNSVQAELGVISVSFIHITSLLNGVPGSGLLNHAINLYLRFHLREEQVELMPPPSSALVPSNELFKEWVRSILKARKALEVLENINGMYVVYIERVFGRLAREVAPAAHQGKLDLDVFCKLVR